MGSDDHPCERGVEHDYVVVGARAAGEAVCEVEGDGHDDLDAYVDYEEAERPDVEL